MNKKLSSLEEYFSLHMKVVKIKDQIVEVNNALHVLMQELVQSKQFEDPTSVLYLNHQVNEARLRNLNIRR